MMRIVKISVSLLLFSAAMLYGQGIARESGLASWYGPGFQGRLTASGERFDTNKLTAAHKTLPFGTLVRVTNRENGKSVVVRINDRGPFVSGRIIDLSRAAADEIDMLESGTVRVDIETLESVGGIAEQQKGPVSLQVASFSDPGNAERLRRRLAAANIESSVVPSGPYHRVIIDGVAQDELEGLLERLGELGYQQPIIR